MAEVLARLIFDDPPEVPSEVPYEPQPISPKKRYHLLPTIDKAAILAFMCSLAVSSKAIHAHMESCEEQLTELRKQKIEVNRSKKQLYVFRLSSR